MKYQKRLNIWALSEIERDKLQPGQHVKAGQDGPFGVYLGQLPGGTDVVAWHGNAKSEGASYRRYLQALRQYAKR